MSNRQLARQRLVVARAPLRVSFGGGGTDLPGFYRRHGGLVVSAAISRYCYAVAQTASEPGIAITSSDYGTWEKLPPDVAPCPEGPLALPRAVLEWFWERRLLPSGLDLFLASEVAPGSGLGSSSSMTVAILRVLAQLAGLPVDPGWLAEMASAIEIDRLGMPIGKQDQYASAHGGLNSIEFSREATHATPLTLEPGVVRALSERLLLFSTGRTRNSAAILQQQSSDAAGKEPVVRSLLRLKALAAEMRTALETGRLDDFGRLMDLGWREKKRLSRRISSSLIDSWYRSARAAGALGGKIAGAGGGGFLLLYCPLSCQPDLRAEMARLGLRELPFDFDFQGAAVVSEQWTHEGVAGRLAVLEGFGLATQGQGA